MAHFLSDIKKIHPDLKNNTLMVLEGANTLPLDVKRIFIIKGDTDAIRGHHAHRTLTQYFTCVHGECIVTCDDGQQKKEFTLRALGYSLLIPPGIWTKQLYRGNDTVLMVACDAPYDESDYIRDYQDFIYYRSESKEISP